MKVLLIGGTGLISTSIVDQLVARGDEVTVFNRGISESRIPKSVKVIQGDRWKYAEFEKQMEGFSFDAVIDMVAFAPENAESLLRAFKGRVKQIVVCSTVCVYGGPLTKLPASDDEPHRPVGEYGKNKSKIESILLNANGDKGLQTTVLRPSFTTGEGTTASGILFDDSLPNRLRQGLPVIIMDQGKAAWAVAHVSDVARGFVNCLLNPKAYGQAYHLTSDEHTDWNGVFGELARAVGARLHPVHIPTDWLYAQAPHRAVGVKYIYQYPSVFDNSKAARDLGFKTTVPLVETFRRQIAWMEKAGKLKEVGEDRFEDLMIEAFQKGGKPVLPEGMDWNPWGNQTTG
ncbi:MAG TPA: NAD-dependent epimerase/dehydratase family protein [bacterium]|nr:NAD-dependent epimerase/dehydratase family protein [bacterium]